jgi:hypothetical protein
VQHCPFTNARYAQNNARLASILGLSAERQ